MTSWKSWSTWLACERVSRMMSCMTAWALTRNWSDRWICSDASCTLRSLKAFWSDHFQRVFKWKSEKGSLRQMEEQLVGRKDSFTVTCHSVGVVCRLALAIALSFRCVPLSSVMGVFQGKLTDALICVGCTKSDSILHKKQQSDNEESQVNKWHNPVDWTRHIFQYINVKK